MLTHERPYPLRVCVFGGARAGNRPHDLALARRTGELLGRRGHEVIYGAGGVGIMGAVAWAAAAAGAPITGVVPGFLRERERDQDAPAQRLIVTDDMFDRKRIMLDRADAFLVLPGGHGTLDEIIEVVSLQSLGLTGKPMVLLGADGIWDHLISLLDELTLKGFADPVVSLYLADTAEEAIRSLEGDVAAAPVSPAPMTSSTVTSAVLGEAVEA